MIVVKNLVKKFFDSNGELTVLNGISFEIKKGEFVSILGPVGCGKSTLLNILAGLEKPTSGEVIINGERIKRPREDIAIIFQGSPLFPWKTVTQNVELPIRNKVDKKKKDKLVEKSLEKVGMKKFADLFPRQLSGGMKQKTSFARILVSHPKILLLDEPFSMLDSQTRILMQSELLKLQEEIEATVLFVTHNIEEAIFLSDRIILLSSLPTQIVKIININLPRPRIEEIKIDNSFNQIRKEVFSLLKNEIIKSSVKPSLK